tara:strand:+ start:1105 stop:1668 length:564 start_codon:yes stop_codon:yes gene_type:complete
MNRREVIKALGFLTGGAIIGSQAFLVGCTNKDEGPILLLSEEQQNLLEEIAETILPKTKKSPGAKDAKVGEFMRVIVYDYYDAMEQKVFVEGLEIYRTANFVSLTNEEKLRYLLAKEKEATETPKIEVLNKLGETLKMTQPYHMYKQLTIWGYRTSEIVANNVYDFAPIPGRYDGCVEVTSDTKLIF